MWTMGNVVSNTLNVGFKAFCFTSCVFFSDFLFKLLLIGDSGVGKSCLLLRFAVGMFKTICFKDAVF